MPSGWWWRGKESRSGGCISTAGAISTASLTLRSCPGGKGFGTALRSKPAEYKPVTIHVERMNPALSFYRRLGFESVADKGVYLLLERRPGAGVQPAP